MDPANWLSTLPSRSYLLNNYITNKIINFNATILHITIVKIIYYSRIGIKLGNNFITLESGPYILGSWAGRSHIIALGDKQKTLI